jgi:threonine dehydrogenase-like Zn-dependent dehydrogenase
VVSSCVSSRLFGSPKLDGGQAEYVLVPLAESVLFHAPTSIPETHVILMADIFPTGFHVAKQGWGMLNETEKEGASVVVLGCGPVGLCVSRAKLVLIRKA